MRILGLRVWAVVGLVFFAAVGIGVLWFTVGRGPQPGDVVFQDDFAAPSSQWPAGASSGGFTSFSGGTYLVGVDPGKSISALTDLPTVQQDVRVEATVVRMPSAGDVLVGRACRADATNRFYELAVSGSGQWVVVRRPDLTVLGKGTFDASILGSGAVHLIAECAGGGDPGHPLRLAISVNGGVVGVAHERTGEAPLPAGGIGFVVVNGSSDPADVHFDDLRVLVA
jgi:hypothetical protein